MSIIYAIDIAGTFAFAISGALVALKKDFDVFGVIISSAVLFKRFETELFIS